MGKKNKQSHVVDFDDYDEKEGGSGYDGEPPLKGTFDGILFALSAHESAAGNDGYQWIFEITEEPYAGWRGYVYSNMDSAKWKTQQIVKAINGGKEVRTELDLGEEDGTGSKTVAKAKPVRLRMKKEKYEDEWRAKIARVMPRDTDSKAGKKKAKKDDEPPF